MALHVDAALHVEPVENVTQNSIQAAIEHGCWRAAADVEGGHRPFADESGVDIDLAQDGLRAPLHHFRMINHFVVRTVRIRKRINSVIGVQALACFPLDSRLKPALQREVIFLRTLRTEDLVTEGNMEIEAERINVSNCVLEGG
jgi:hypothetical protein